MTIENAVLREDLRAWMKSPAMGLQEYSSDLIPLWLQNCARGSLYASKRLMWPIMATWATAKLNTTWRMSR